MNDKVFTQVRFASFEVDLYTHELKKDGTKLKLVGQPFEILAALLKRPGELVTRKELRVLLWPDDTFVNFDHGLNAAIKKLREVLSDSAEQPRYVETLPRRGYRFIAKVEPLGATAPRPFLEIKPPAESTPEAPVPRSSDAGAIRAPWLRFRYLVGAAALFALLIGASVFLKIRSTGATGALNSLAQHTYLLTSSASGVREPAFSPNGDRVAFRRRGVGGEESGLFVQNASFHGAGARDPIQLTKNAEDCCPAWSPDASEIAFMRGPEGHLELFVVPSAGGPETKMQLGGMSPRRGEVDWSPAGDYIAFSAGGIFIYSPETSSVHKLTEPPSSTEDWGPAFSPDGSTVLFLRGGTPGTPEQLMFVPVRGGEATPIFSDAAGFDGPAPWSPDGRSVIFASERSGHPALWKLSLKTRDEPIEVIDGGWRPAVSRNGYRLAYQRTARSLHIWKKELPDAGSKGDSKAQVLVPSTSQTDQGPGPQFSPDGKKLAYMSDRSGTMEIWVSDMRRSPSVPTDCRGPGRSRNASLVARRPIRRLRRFGSGRRVDLCGEPEGRHVPRFGG